MKKEASLSEIQSSGDAAFRYEMMREVIETVADRGKLFMPLLNLVTTFIDGLASGAPGTTKAAYLEYLDKHFPELCKALGAEIFYSKYRCGAVHEFNLKAGFGIARDSRMDGAYVGTQTIKETGEELTVLNIDRLVADFIRHVSNLEAELKNPSSAGGYE
jgi:hypothetical protein